LAVHIRQAARPADREGFSAGHRAIGNVRCPYATCSKAENRQATRLQETDGGHAWFLASKLKLGDRADVRICHGQCNRLTVELRNVR
jgi:hypothetical protein